MNSLSLNGTWRVCCKNRDLTLEGTVPGDVHNDLLRAGAISDPFDRDNELELQWIGKSDWSYTRKFRVEGEFRSQRRVRLVCDGLDTLATVVMNGQEVGRSNNMFRRWEWDVGPMLEEGTNCIEITFASAIEYCVAANHREPPLYWNNLGSSAPFSLLRKQACNFGWDWGTMITTCGIWKDIQLIAFSDARIDYLKIDQTHQNGTVRLGVESIIEEAAGGPYTVAARLTRKGETVAEGDVSAVEGVSMHSLLIENPDIWWPSNLGEQPVYRLEVSLKNADGNILDQRAKQIALRTIELDCHADAWGESFQFVVNGVPFFAKGANWIPVDAVLARASRADYERLIQASVDANMNMLRVWGGGIYEPDCFYEICTEKGILVWQDFMYACAPYPLDEKAFFDNAVIEAQEQVQRLHHFGCLALWCGNNEMEQMAVGPEWTSQAMSWEDYCPFFDDALKAIIETFSAGIDYWPSSAHSPVGDRGDFQSPRSGDAHLWNVWHGAEPFEWYRTTEHRFVSEYGFQSFPAPKTVETYTEPQDRNITSWVMEHHQRSGIGNAKIMHYMLAWYRLPTGFENTLWTSQIQQGMAITYAVEHWRRNMPRTMGSLYWQLNDYWPVASWASIDYHGRWKALHYMARRFYAPLLVSGVEDMANGTAEVHVSNDRRTDARASLRYWITDLGGELLYADEEGVILEAGRSKKVRELDIKEKTGSYSPRTMLLWLELEAENGEISSNLLLFARPKHLDLAHPTFSRTLRDHGDGRYTILLESKAVALWTWFELTEADATFSDNFIHVRPGRVYSVAVYPREPISAEQLEAQLTIRSLVDTYS